MPHTTMICSIPLREFDCRLASAIGTSISYFERAKSPTDFYLEELLNVFLALAMAPLNFAIFKMGGNKLKAIKHFCTDEKHISEFEILLHAIETSSEITANSFPLFPDILGKEKYRIAIFLMNTKHLSKDDKTGITVVQPNKESAPGDECRLAEYVALCAERYFGGSLSLTNPYHTSFAKRYIEASLSALERGTAFAGGAAPRLDKETNKLLPPRPVQNEEVITHLIDTRFPYETGSSPPFKPRDMWKRKLSRTLDSVLNYSVNGVEFLNGFFSKNSGDTPSLKDDNTDIFPNDIANMFIAFRCFSRSADRPRHKQKDINASGYYYDVSFLLSTGVRSALKSQFEQMRDCGECAEGFKNTFGYPKYSDSEHASRSELANYAAQLDDWFWELVDNGDHGELIGTFESWIGDDTRSMTDPVFHTGLIHQNFLFENFGLERIGGHANSSKGDGVELSQDGKRIVILYYLVCGVVAQQQNQYSAASESRSVDPLKVAMLMIPLKMCGGVWGVVMHAVYIEDKERPFKSSDLWDGYFRLSTSHYRKMTAAFDHYLWSLAVGRVRARMATAIKHMAENSFDDTLAPLQDLSAEFINETRASPFAFPLFYASSKPPLSDKYSSIPFLGELMPDSDLKLHYYIEQNRFFVPHQPWDGQSRRGFEEEIKSGIYLGLL